MTTLFSSQHFYLSSIDFSGCSSNLCRPLLKFMAAVRYASTTLLRSRSQFNDLLSTVRGISRGRLLLYALSYNAPDIENSLKDISSCSTETIGCLSSPIFLTNASDSQTFSCSIALLDDTLSTPFDISKTGKGPVQVGRWHAFRKEETSNSDHLLDNNVDWNNVWKARNSTNFLPDEMKNIRFVELHACLLYSHCVTGMQRHSSIFPTRHRLNLPMLYKSNTLTRAK